MLVRLNFDRYIVLCCHTQRDRSVQGDGFFLNSTRVCQRLYLEKAPVDFDDLDLV